MVRTRSAIKDFWLDQHAGTFSLVAVGLLVMLGAAVLVIDMGNSYSLEARLQSAADAAALAAAREIPDTTAAKAMAQEYALKNMGTKYGSIVGENDVRTGNWDSSTRNFGADTNPVNAVEVVARMSELNGNAAPTFFGRIFGVNSIDISARSIATAASNRCVYVMDSSDRGALSVTGTAQIEMDCGVAVNSNDDWGIQQIGADSCMLAPSIEVVGGYTINCTSSEPVTGISPLADPLANLPPPDWFECDFGSRMTISSDTTLSPATYCNNVSIQSGANVTLEPGVYIFGYSNFNIASNATVSGEDVTIYFSEFGSVNSGLTISGGANVNLTAPDTGPYEGVVFFSDRNAIANITHRFTGGSTMNLTGIIYAPNQELHFAGGAELTGSCVTIIARSLTFNGDTNISASTACPDGLAPLGNNVQLVQ